MSGVREVFVEADSTSDLSNIRFYYNEIKAGSVIAHTLTTRGGKAYAVLAPNGDTAGYSSGTLFIGGIKISDAATEGTKNVSVVLNDAALNSSNSANTSIVYDKSAPVIESAVVNNVVVDGSRKWLRHDAFTPGASNVPNKATITVTAVETTSGIETIKLTGVKLTSATKLYSGNSASGTAVNCTVNESTGTITLPYSASPSLKSSGKVVFTVSGIQFTSGFDNGQANSIGVELEDFAGNKQTRANCDSVYIDSKPAAKPAIVVSDSVAKGINLWNRENTKNSYTDSSLVDIKVTVTGNTSVESGIKSLTFTNAQFGSEAILPAGATASGSTVTFSSVQNGNQTFTFTGVKLTEANKTTTVTVYSTDLIGWASAAGSYSIMHDSVRPSFGSGGPAWVSAMDDVDGITDNINQSLATKKQKLKIPYVETGSGLKAVKIENANLSSIAVKNDTTAITKFTVQNSNYIVFEEPLVSSAGNLFIEGLSLDAGAHGSEDAIYTVKVGLYDIAENDDGRTTGNDAALCVDKTKPSLDRIEFPQIERIKHFGDPSWLYYFGKDCLDGNVTIRLHVTEKTSGLRVVDFAGSLIKPTSNSTIKIIKNGTETPITSFKLTGGNKIEFMNSMLTKVANDTGSEFVLEITKCALSNIKTSGSGNDVNRFSISLADFAGNSSDVKKLAKFNDTSDDIEEVSANSLASVTPVLKLIDNSKHRNSSNVLVSDIITAKEKFTNYEIVNAELTIPSSSAHNDFNEVELTANAEFIQTGEEQTSISVEYGGSPVSLNSDDYEITARKIIFKNYSFAPSSDLKINVTNMKLTGAEGAQTVKAITTAPTKKASSAGEYAITLDKTPPRTTGAVSYSDASNTSVYPKTVDAVTPTYGVKFEADGIPYFYTSGATRLFDIINRETSGTYYKVDANDYFIKISTNKTTVADIYNDSGALTEFEPTSPKVTIKTESQNPATASPYSYIVYDVAGNYSEVKQFYLIKDEAAQDVAVNKIAAYDSATAHFFKNAPSGGTRTYVMKQATNEYKIVVDLSDYAEKSTDTTHSGLAQWAITSDGANPTSWKNYDSSQNGGNIEYFIDSVTEGKKLTLFLKDNCGNTTNIDIKDDDGYTNTILWTVDSTAPKVVFKDSANSGGFKASSTMTSLTEGTADQGDVYGKTYWTVGSQTSYFNDNAALEVTYEAESCLYSDEYAGETEHDYTVKAKLFFTDGLTTADEETIAAADSTESYASPWYYFADKPSTGNRTFFVPIPHRAEGVSGNLWLLLEDTVGNRNVTRVQNYGVYNSNLYLLPYFCYVKTSPAIMKDSDNTAYTSGSTLDFTAASAGKYYVASDKIYVNGNTVPEFDLKLEKNSNITDGRYFVYYSYKLNDTITNPVAADINTTYTDASTFAKVPVGSLTEAAATATASPLYLYVRDVIGNWQKVQLGNKPYLKDSKPPVATSWTGKVKSNPGNSNITQLSTTGKMQIVIAASSEDYLNTPAGAPYTVYIPREWFTDNGGSDIKGLTFLDSPDLGDDLISSDGNSFKLNIPFNVYDEDSGLHTGTYYVYDKVGNYTSYAYETSVDSKAPEVELKFTVANKYLYSTDFTCSNENQTASLAKTNISNFNAAEFLLWSSNPSVSLEISASDTNGIASVNFDGDLSNSDVKNVTLTALVTGSTHTVVVTDRAGNTTTRCFTLKLDADKPTFSEAVATPNDGARIKNVSGTNTLYYNSLDLTAKVSDGSGVGLDSYKTPGETDYTTIPPASIVSGKYSITAAENAGNAVTVYAKDKLKNEDSVSAWKVGTETISTFVFDNTAPGWDASPITLTRNGFVNNGNSKTWESGTATSNSLASYDSSARKIYIKSNLDANVVITPVASDTSGIVGYIASTSSTKPVVNSTTEYPTEFLLACGTGKATNFVDTVKKTIPTGTQTAAATDANFNLKLADGQSLKVYFFPVDYAGNVGAAQEVTFAYQENRPVVVGDIEVGSVSGYRIHQEGGVNYFRGVSANAGSPNAATGEDITGAQVTAEISLADASTFPLTGFKLVTSSGTELAHHTYAASSTKAAGTHTFNLPYSFNASTTEDVYIVFYNNAGDSVKQKLEYGTATKLATWANDKFAPNKPDSVRQVKSASDTDALNDGLNGFYLNGTNLYYNASPTTAYLNFTLGDNATSSSGIKGVGTSSTLGLDDFANITNPYKIDSTVIAAAAGGKQTFYAYDNVLNREEIGYEITFIKDIAKPNITSVTVEGQSGSGYHRPADTDTFYFNAKDGYSKKVTAITFTVNANDEDGGTELSGIRSYKFVVDGVEKQNTDSKTFILSNIDYTNGNSVAITVIDNVRNESTTKTITLIPDAVAPVISVDTFKNGDDDIEDSSLYISTTDTTWKTASGGTVYFNGNTGKIDNPKITFKADSAGEVSGVNGNVSVSYSGGGSGISKSDNATTTVTATVSDMVGNESTFIVTFEADNSAPEFEHTGFYKDDAKASLEAKYISPVIAAGTATYYYNSNGTRKALPVFTARDGGAKLKGVYIRSGSTDTALSKNDSVYYYDATSYGVEQTFVAIDKVGNEAEIKFTTIQDATAPTISSAGPAVSPYIKKDGTDSKKYYFNAGKTGSIYNVTSIALTVTADDNANGAGIASYKYQWQGNTVEKKVSDGSANEYTINSSDMDYENAKTMTITATDKVGNTCAEYVVTFVPIKPPRITVATFTSGGTDYADDTTYISAPSNWKTVSESGTVYFNANAGKISSPAITFTITADTGIDIVSSPVSYSVDGASASGISAEDGKETVVIARATDDVGTTSEFTVTFKADKTAPTLTPSTNIESKYLSEGISIEGSVYFNSAKVTLPTISFTSDDGSGNSGVDGSVSVTYSGDSTTKISAVDSETTTVTATVKDKVGNIGTYTITFTADGTKPTIGSPVFSGVPVAVYKNGNTIFYKNDAATPSGVLKFTLADSEGTKNSGLKDGTKFLHSATALTESPATPTFLTEYTLNSTTLATETNYFYAVDKAGNLSDPCIFTFTADITPPSVSVDLKNDAADIDSGYIYSEATDWKTATGKTVYFNSTQVTDPKAVFTATDTGGSSAGESIPVSATYTVDGAGAAKISTTDGKTTKVTATTADNVGNEATFNIDFVADGIGPDKPTVSVVKSDGTAIASGTYYPADFASWVGGIGVTYYFSAAASASKVKFSTPTDSGSGFDALYNGGTKLTASEVAISSGTATVNVVAKDRVGNESDAIEFTAKLDNTMPDITNVTVSGGADKTDYWKLDGTTLYFNEDQVSSITISFEAGDDDSGLNSVTSTSGGSAIGTLTAGTGADAGKYTVTIDAADISASTEVTLTAKDNVGNEKTYASTITLVPVSAPTITAVSISTPAGQSRYLYQDTSAAGNPYYFNASSTEVGGSTEYNLKSINFEVSATADAVELKSYSYKWGDGETQTKLASATEPEKYTRVLASADYTATSGITMKITVTDELGKTAEFTAIFNADGAAPDTPSVTSITLGTYDNIYPEKETGATLNWTDGSTVWFTGDSAEVLFAPDSDGTGGSGLEGIYNWVYNSTDDKYELGTMLTDRKVSPSAAENVLKVVSVDNVGNVSAPFTITLKKDNAAPSITGLTSGVLRYASSSSGWLELNDTSGTLQMALYDGVTVPSASVISDAGVGSVSYAFSYGAAASDSSLTWAEYDSSSGISLPSVTTAENSYLFLWLKDALGNTASTKIDYAGKPIGKYAAPTGTTPDVTTETSGGNTVISKLVIADYPLAAGLKSVIIKATEITAVVDSIAVANFSSSVRSYDASNGLTITATDSANNPLVIKHSGNITINFYYPQPESVTVSVVDANDEVTQVYPTPAGSYSMRSILTSGVRGGVSAAAAKAAGQIKRGKSPASASSSVFQMPSLNLPFETILERASSDEVSSKVSESARSTSPSVSKTKKRVTSEVNIQKNAAVESTVRKSVQKSEQTSEDIGNVLLSAEAFVTDEIKDRQEIQTVAKSADNTVKTEIPLAENKIIEYDTMVRVSGASSELVKAIVAIVAIVIAVASIIVLVSVFMLKRKRVK